MKKLTISLDKYGVPASIWLEGTDKPWNVNPSDEPYFSKEADWLCLFALYTALSRAEKDEQTDCPCFSEVSQSHTRSIAGALYEKRNFKKASQLYIPSEHEGECSGVAKETEDRRHWLVKIFDEPPAEKFLTGSKSPGNERLRFSPAVGIEVLKLGAKVEGADELNGIFRAFERVLKQLEKSLYIRLEISDPLSKEAPIQLVDSRESWGRLRKGVAFSIQVTTTYETNLAVFWIATKRDVVSLYPYPNIEIPLPQFIPSLAGGVLEVIAPRGFEVHPPEGFDFCVVVTREKKFSKKEIEEFRLSLQEIVQETILSKRLRSDDHPSMKKFSVVRKRTPAISEETKKLPMNQRFGPREELKGWINDAVSLFSGKAEILNIFEVPNQQS